MKKDKHRKKYQTFIKVLKAHHPDLHVSYNPPHGWATSPAYLKEEHGEPVGAELLARALTVAKLRKKSK